MELDKSKHLEEFAQKMAVEFNDLSFLNIALTHSSFVRDNDHAGSSSGKDKSNSHPRQGSPGTENNQRMEFLGDAVLELVVSEYLYKLFPAYHEGELTKLRAAMVCEASLAKMARKFDLGNYISMGKGEILSGGRRRSSILADAFEAVLGAVFLDRGLEACREFIIRCIEPVLHDIISGDYDRDFKTELQEYIQHKSAEKVSYTILKEEGPDHNKTFTAGLVLQGKVVSKSSGRSKKEAEQHAARNYLQRLAEQRSPVHNKTDDEQ